MLKVWGRTSSSNVQALMWCIGELGLKYERYDVGHRYGGTETEEFARLNPNRTVPVLQDGENQSLWETGAILRYLASRYADSTFWPEETVERANVDRWAEWSKINIALGFTAPVFWRVVRTPVDKRDPDAISTAVKNLERKLNIAEHRLGQHSFLAGDNFTLADIQFGHVLYRYYDIEIERESLPNLHAYYQQLAIRPEYRKHVMVSYDELRE